MTSRLRRTAAIVGADLRIRFRRRSTLVSFLVLGFMAWLSVPDPASGNALLIVENGRRALYDSAALGMATAILASLFVGLAGFYVVSNAVGRDLVTRCGSVIASTTVRSGEYVVAKFLGNAAFLGIFTAGFMVVSMGMLAVRAEAALAPGIFVRQYLLLTPSSIVFTAVLAIVFEASPRLAGRLGDVLYFVAWLTLVSAVTALSMSGVGASVARYLDFAGLGLVAQRILPTLATPNLSIGGSFDPTQPLYVFPGLALDRSWTFARTVSLLLPLPLLAVAARSFHRFDPAVVRAGADARRTGWLARANVRLARLTRLLPAPTPSVPGSPILASAFADARTTVATTPSVVPVTLGVAVATVTSSTQGFMRGVLPLTLALLGLLIADAAARDRRSGTLDLLYSMPALRRGYLWWKLLGCLLVSALVLSLPLGRLAITDTGLLPAFVSGVLLIVGAGTSIGVVSGSSKGFTVVLLTWMYLVTTDGGRTPALDFAGLYGHATPGIALRYASVTAGLLAIGHLVHRARLR